MNILFITSNRIGDAVLSTGLLGWLIERHPDARFTIVCGPAAQDLFRAIPGLERLMVLHKKPFNGHWIDLWKACASTRWDLIVDLRNSVVSRLLRAKRCVYRPANSTGRHKVVDTASAFGLDSAPSPRLWLDDAAESEADRLVPDGGPVLALGPAANWPAKQWQIGKFISLAQKLTAGDGPLPRARVLVAAAAHEREQVAPLMAALSSGQAIDTIGQDLLTVAACLKRCRLFIGNDSGLMHIAAAVGAPTLGLFGPGYERIYGPWGPKGAVVRTPESTAELLARLPYPGAFHPNLMGSLSVEAVVEGARELLART